MKTVSFVDGVGKTSFVDNVGKNTKFLVDGKSRNEMPKHKHYSMNSVPCPEPMTREQFEEMGRELEKTDKMTGLWYPHKGRC